MMKTSQDGFWDPGANKKIYYWQDYYFDIYLASSRLGYRIKIK